jgi:uncharacterized YigZ family protein
MSKIDQYRTISSISTGEYREKGSKFIALAYPFNTEENLKDIIHQLKKEHLKARHHCYAYKIGTDGNNFRMNDDGEPSGTAGKPIFGQIEKSELTNILVVVIRYFGGTKLGTSGLIRAYKSSTLDALSKANIISKTKIKRIKIQFEYDKMGDLLNAIKKLKMDIIAKSFDETPFVIIALPDSETGDSLKALKASLEGKSVEEIDEDYKVENIIFEIDE